MCVSDALLRLDRVSNGRAFIAYVNGLRDANGIPNHVWEALIIRGGALAGE